MVQKVDVEVVINVLVAETASWPTGAFVAPVVVVVGDVEMTLIDVS